MSQRTLFRVSASLRRDFYCLESNVFGSPCRNEENSSHMVQHHGMFQGQPHLFCAQGMVGSYLSDNQLRSTLLLRRKLCLEESLGHSHIWHFLIFFPRQNAHMLDFLDQNQNPGDPLVGVPAVRPGPCTWSWWVLHPLNSIRLLWRCLSMPLTSNSDS